MLRKKIQKNYSYKVFPGTYGNAVPLPLSKITALLSILRLIASRSKLYIFIKKSVGRYKWTFLNHFLKIYMELLILMKKNYDGLLKKCLTTYIFSGIHNLCLVKKGQYVW